MIQIYHPLYFVEMIVCFRQFSGEQGLLSGKHFQIGGATAVFHQLAGTFHGAAERLSACHQVANGGRLSAIVQEHRSPRYPLSADFAGKRVTLPVAVPWRCAGWRCYAHG